MTIQKSVSNAFVAYKKDGEKCRLTLATEFNGISGSIMAKPDMSGSPITVAQELSCALADLSMGQIRLNNIVRRLAQLCLGARPDIRSNGMDLTIEVMGILDSEKARVRGVARAKASISKALENLGVNVRRTKDGYRVSCIDNRKLLRADGSVESYGFAGIELFYKKGTALDLNNAMFEDTKRNLEAIKIDGANSVQDESAQGEPVQDEPAQDENTNVTPAYGNTTFKRLEGAVNTMFKKLNKEIVGASPEELSLKRLEKDVLTKYKSDLETLINKIRSELEGGAEASKQ